MHKNKEMDDIKKGKEVIIIKVRLVVTFGRRNGGMITMGSIRKVSGVCQSSFPTAGGSYRTSDL